MAAWTYACKTAQGKNLDLKLLGRGGIPLKLTRGMAGSGKADPTQLTALTGVIGPVQEAGLHKVTEYPDENKIMLPVMLKNTGVTKRYAMNQLGIYAEDPDLGEILYLVLQSDGPEEIPSGDEMKDFTLEWHLNLSVSDAEKVEVAIDQAGYATVGDVDAVERRVAAVEDFHGSMEEMPDGEVEAVFAGAGEAEPGMGGDATFLYFAKRSLRKLCLLISSHYVGNTRKINGKALQDDITLSAEDVKAVSESDKGKAGGVAELDSTGKVPPGQLPLAIKIGDTEGTAFRGDLGKTAYEHSLAAHAPVDAEQNVQADWDVSDTGSDAYIRNKPGSLPASGGNSDTVNGHTVGANVPSGAKFTDTTYGNMKGATASAAGASGLAPAPAAGSQNKFLRGDGTWQDPPNNDTVYSHPTTPGNKHIPSGGSSGQILRWSADGTAVWGADNNTTYGSMKGATASAAGSAGLAPAPAAGNQNKFLRGDGTWADAGGVVAGASAPSNTSALWVDTGNGGVGKYYDPSSKSWKTLASIWG